jgi:hypothetical protein
VTCQAPTMVSWIAVPMDREGIHIKVFLLFVALSLRASDNSRFAWYQYKIVWRTHSCRHRRRARVS